MSLIRAAVVGFACIMFVTSARGEDSREKTYIVKTHDASTKNGYLSQSVRALNANYVANEMSENVDGVTKTQALPNTGYVIVKTNNSDATIDALKRNPYVDYVEENRFMWKTDAYQNPSPPDLGADHPASFSYGPWLKDVLGYSAADQFRLDPTIAYNEGGTPSTPPTYPSVKVAVIDTGATVSHPFLKPGLAFNEREIANNGLDDDGDGYVDDVWGWNTTNNTGDISEVGTDHGSHVAGIIKSIRDQAAAISDYQAAARKVEVLPIRFISEAGVGSTEAAILAIEYAHARHAKVINASWGARGTDAYSKALYDAFVQAYTRDDMVVVVAAGNAEGGIANDNDKIPYFPASFNIPSLVTVASITAEYVRIGGTPTMTYNGLSDFSNYGLNSVDFAAPGGYKSTDGDSTGIWSANAQATSGALMYIRKKGTSMAAPVISGIAGVIRAIRPSLTAYEVTQILENAVVKTDRLSTAVRTGGYVSARKAYDLAAVANTANAKPAVPADPYSTYQTNTAAQSAPASSGGGGCGALVAAGAAPGNGSGPFGGNSLFLFSGGYLLLQLFRKIKRHLKSHSV